MVHCISSSEPDPSDIPTQDQEWKHLQASSSHRNDAYAAIAHIDKLPSSHLASAESSTLVTSLHYGSDQEAISSSKHFDRKSPGECCAVMETHHEQMSLFGGNGGIHNQNEINENVHGDDHAGHHSEGEEDEDSHEGNIKVK